MVYNHDALLHFCQDKQYTNKTLNIYKYVASSKLKAVCQTVREKFVDEFDHFSIRIINEDFVEQVPMHRMRPVFYADTCTPMLRWTLAILLLPLLPLLLIEKLKRHTYESGLVFRIRRAKLDAAERELIKITDAAVADLDVSLRKYDPQSQKQLEFDQIIKETGGVAVANPDDETTVEHDLLKMARI